MRIYRPDCLNPFPADLADSLLEMALERTGLSKEQLENLQTIPGVKKRAALSLIAEIGVDMDQFPDSNHLASWSGLKPRNDESNKHIKSRRITHGNKYLRRTVIQCAWGASRTKECYFSRFLYTQTQVRKKNKMKVIVAIGRKMLVAAWHVLKHNTAYKDFVPREQGSGDGKAD